MEVCYEKEKRIMEGPLSRGNLPVSDAGQYQ